MEQKTPATAEKTLFEILLDQDNADNVVLLQENGTEIEFEQIALIVLDQRYFCILHPLNLEGIGEDDAVVYELDDSAEEDRLLVVDDEKLATRVFDEYYKLVAED